VIVNTLNSVTESPKNGVEKSNTHQNIVGTGAGPMYNMYTHTYTYVCICDIFIPTTNTFIKLDFGSDIKTNSTYITLHHYNNVTESVEPPSLNRVVVGFEPSRVGYFSFFRTIFPKMT